MNNWQTRHATAVVSPREGHETAITCLFDGLATYASAHRDRYESPIGEDYFLGPRWLEIATALRDLLNGEVGRLDAGTLDSFLLATIESAGFDTSEL